MCYNNVILVIIMYVRLWARVCALTGSGARGAHVRAGTRVRVSMCMCVRDRVHVRACVRARVLT